MPKVGIIHRETINTEVVQGMLIIITSSVTGKIFIDKCKSPSKIKG